MTESRFTADMSLAPDPHVIRSLLSTPSRLIGQLETRNRRLQIVFQTSRVAIQTAFKTGPHSRNYFLLSLRVPDDPVEAFAVPTTTLSDGEVMYHYDAVGKRLTDLAAAWFGKRFDYHGEVVSNSILYMPDLSSISPSSYSELGPYNHKLRSDLGIELNLEELRPVLGLLYKRQPERELAAFWAATRFYARALRAYETDPEVAFFHFVVSLEIIASQIEVPSEDLYDKQIKNDLKAIEEKLGAKVAARIRDRLRQLRRRVIYAAKHFVNDAFFEGSQAKPPYKLTRDKLESCVKAVYDLRSSYAHGGAQFGIWFEHQVGGATAEVQVGHPVLPNSQKKLEKILPNIPTFVGLERLVRFIILRFASLNIQELHQKLK
jgi:hypothetical protein